MEMHGLQCRRPGLAGQVPQVRKLRQGEETMSYTPTPENAKWLDWLIDRIKDAPYEVTTRWAFYRLVQEFNFTKGDYKKFLSLTSRARKEYYGEYTPTTFVDDTREMSNHYGTGYDKATDWVESMRSRSPKLAIEHAQNNIVFVCFEAKAMIRQFEHYLDRWRVCLVPFGGDPSIHYKHKLAELIEEAAELYEKPIRVLYFGDYDPKGMEIPLNAMRDVRRWTDAEFEFVRVGINPEHIEELGIVEDPEHPGKFQWEALDEKAAEKLINRVFEFWDKDAIAEIKRKEREAGEIWNAAVEDVIDKVKATMGDDDS